MDIIERGIVRGVYTRGRIGIPAIDGSKLRSLKSIPQASLPITGGEMFDLKSAK